MPEGIDANTDRTSSLTPEQQSRLDEIKQLDSQVFSAGRGSKSYKTFYEQHDAETKAQTKLDDLVTQLSGKTGIPKEDIVAQTKEERRLQNEIDTKSNELSQIREQRGKRYETIVRTEARPPQP